MSAEWADEDRVLATVEAAIRAGAGAAINATGRGGNTALHGAARNRFSAVAELLVAHGADLDLENEGETTPRTLLERLEAGQ